MPIVPNVPGVPALSSYLTNAVPLIFADAISLLFGGPANPWGIYLNGRPAFDFESFNSFSFKKEFVIADYPIEGDGGSSGFMSYDKVELPFECRVRLISGGSESEREALLTQVETAAADLELYDIVTPERLYQSCNIQRFGVERTSTDGVGVIKIDIVFQQIRSSEISSFSNTQQPGSAGQQGLGNVQPKTIGGHGNIVSLPLASVQ